MDHPKSILLIYQIRGNDNISSYINLILCNLHENRLKQKDICGTATEFLLMKDYFIYPENSYSPPVRRAKRTIAELRGSPHPLRSKTLENVRSTDAK